MGVKIEDATRGVIDGEIQRLQYLPRRLVAVGRAVMNVDVAWRAFSMQRHEVAEQSLLHELALYAARQHQILDNYAIRHRADDAEAHGAIRPETVGAGDHELGPARVIDDCADLAARVFVA